MAYSIDLRNSALRHLRAAETLCQDSATGAQPGNKAVAGYLFGIAAELALKQIMRDNGIKPLPLAQRRQDPFYAHFPELKALLRDRIHGRRAAELRSVVESSRYFQNWDTNMRYAPTKEIFAERVDGWRDDAKKLVDQMGAY